MTSRSDEPVNDARRAFLRGTFARSDIARLDRAACVAWDGVICMSCRLACPDDAIHMDDKSRPSIIERACTGCGQCVDPCPPRAIRMTS